MKVRPDWFAIIYIFGVFFFAADAGNGLGLPFLHALFWALAAPTVWGLGAYFGRQAAKKETS